MESQLSGSRCRDAPDTELLTEYSPLVNEAYWKNRPVRVARQVALLVMETARFTAAYLGDSASGNGVKNSLQRAQQLRKAIERLGPAYIKFAQVCASQCFCSSQYTGWFTLRIVYLYHTKMHIYSIKVS